jgi:hypothetical protein
MRYKVAYWQWRGRTKQGASKYVGSQAGPPKWAWWLLFGLASIEAVIAAGLLIASLFIRVDLGDACGFGLGAAGHALTGWWLRRQYYYIHGMVDEDDAARWLGVDKAELNQIVEERGIRPKYNINGEDFYDRRDFGDVATLLRASAPSVEKQQSLLRAAGNVQAQPDTLLRAEPTADGPQTTTVQPGRERASGSQELRARMEGEP